nr:TPA_asm: hypothetical protein HUJ06_008043 [Nelumbo nucifera]
MDTQRNCRYEEKLHVVPLDTAQSGGTAVVTTTVKYTRTLMNVGTLAMYKVSVTSQVESVKILVDLDSLAFSQPNEKKTYMVTFSGGSIPSGMTSFARLEWLDGNHAVESKNTLG